MTFLTAAAAAGTAILISAQYSLEAAENAIDAEGIIRIRASSVSDHIAAVAFADAFATVRLQRALSAVNAHVADGHLVQTLAVDRRAGEAAIRFASRERIIPLHEIGLARASTAAAGHRRSAFALFRLLTRIAPMTER